MTWRATSTGPQVEDPHYSEDDDAYTEAESADDEEDAMSAAMDAALHRGALSLSADRQAMASFLTPLGRGNTPSPSGSEQRVMRNHGGGGRGPGSAVLAGGGRGAGAGAGMRASRYGGDVGGVSSSGASGHSPGQSPGGEDGSPARRAPVADAFQVMRSRHRQYLDEVGMAMSAIGDEMRQGGGASQVEVVEDGDEDEDEDDESLDLDDDGNVIGAHVGGVRLVGSEYGLYDDEDDEAGGVLGTSNSTDDAFVGPPPCVCMSIRLYEHST